jgi:tRNA(Ile)-lysidine synthase TilS/MesJ
VTKLTRTGLRVIRPLIFAEEREIIAFMKASGFTPVSRTCPYDGRTERSEMRDLLAKMEQEHPDVINTVFGAIRRSDIDGWDARG